MYNYRAKIRKREPQSAFVFSLFGFSFVISEVEGQTRTIVSNLSEFGQRSLARYSLWVAKRRARLSD